MGGSISKPKNSIGLRSFLALNNVELDIIALF